ncbi:MAG TPA: DUF1360 domain-containing protein [Syntrophales bacterium]|nr:DUF1360 domain-containing protein [Syntrophales bacterium]
MLIFKMILAIIATEAIVELLKKAAPLQGIKRRLITWTPFLYSTEQGHLLDCPYCSSVWVGFGMMAALWFMDSTAYLLFSGSLAIHRLSGYLHLVFSLLRDVQLDIRIHRSHRR